MKTKQLPWPWAWTGYPLSLSVNMRNAFILFYNEEVHILGWTDDCVKRVQLFSKGLLPWCDGHQKANWSESVRHCVFDLCICIFLSPCVWPRVTRSAWLVLRWTSRPVVVGGGTICHDPMLFGWAETDWVPRLALPKGIFGVGKFRCERRMMRPWSGAICRTKRDYKNCSVGQEAGVDKCSPVTRKQCW